MLPYNFFLWSIAAVVVETHTVFHGLIREAILMFHSSFEENICFYKLFLSPSYIRIFVVFHNTVFLRGNKIKRGESKHL